MNKYMYICIYDKYILEDTYMYINDIYDKDI